MRLIPTNILYNNKYRIWVEWSEGIDINAHMNYRVKNGQAQFSTDTKALPEPIDLEKPKRVRRTKAQIEADEASASQEKPLV